jgi:hypothetical protein
LLLMCAAIAITPSQILAVDTLLTGWWRGADDGLVYDEGAA